jgi:hypothetical protein
LNVAARLPPLITCDPVNVFPASILASVALEAGNVYVQLSAPAVNVAAVVGAVNTHLFIEVALATPSVGVVNDGEIRFALSASDEATDELSAFKPSAVFRSV